MELLDVCVSVCQMIKQRKLPFSLKLTSCCIFSKVQNKLWSYLRLYCVSTDNKENFLFGYFRRRKLYWLIFKEVFKLVIWLLLAYGSAIFPICTLLQSQWESTNQLHIYLAQKEFQSFFLRLSFLFLFEQQPQLF